MAALSGLNGRTFTTWAALAVLLVSGCGRGPAEQPDSTGSTTSAVATTPPPAEINDRAASAAPQPQGPADLIREIARLKSLPDTVVEVSYKDGQRVAENKREATQDEIAAEQQRRLEKIVELAGTVIKDTHTDPAQEQIFNNAVHYLTDARLQLAILGVADQAQQLTQDAEALFERDSSSFAAVESGHKVVQLAESMAARHGAQNREWVAEYAIQAQQFAHRFPQDEGRSAVSLIAAGRKCEQYGLTEEARNCYFQVEKQFAGSVFATQIAGILRRLRLEGQSLELAGPTIDGGFFDVHKFAGQPMLVVFWASRSEAFRRDMAVLKQISDNYKEPQLTIVGICLDEHESAVDTFLEEYGVAWRQIFFSDPNQRAGRNPVARYFGVHVTPTYWLVDRNGIVTAAPAAIADLPGQVAQLVGSVPQQARQSPVENAPTPQQPAGSPPDDGKPIIIPQ